MRADVVTEFFDETLCEIVRPDDGVKVFTLLEVVLIKPGFVGEKAFDNLSPVLFEPLFVFRVGEFNKFARCGGVQQVHIWVWRIGGAMPAFFLSENENFPAEGFRPPRFALFMLVIGDIEEIFVAMHRYNAFKLGIRLVFNGYVFAEDRINFIHA